MNDMNGNTPGSQPPGEANWERRTLERLAFAALEEQRRARRWKIAFRLAFIFLIALMIAVQYRWEVGSKPSGEKFTALIDLDGEIESQSAANADSIVSGLRAAFEAKNTAGIVLRVNSPGGSPVQSREIYDEIKRLRAKYPNIPLYAVITDMCASGCYYIVSAADKIYADRGSLVGSIGVLMNGFGFTEAMKKLGIERRLLTAGHYKGFLDPFVPLRPDEKQLAQVMLNNIHQQFIDAVRKGRGKALKETKDMFSGLFWTGEQAKEMGLVDEFGTASYVAREVFKAEDIADFTFHEGVLDHFAKKFGASMGETMAMRLLGPKSPAIR